MTFNVGEKYHTRNKNIVELTGVSEYIIFGENVRILTGKLDGETQSWNGEGQHLVSRLFLHEQISELDLLYSKPEVTSPGVYYIQFKKEQR